MTVVEVGLAVATSVTVAVMLSKFLSVSIIQLHREFLLIVAFSRNDKEIERERKEVQATPVSIHH